MEMKKAIFLMVNTVVDLDVLAVSHSYLRPGNYNVCM